MNKIYTKFSIYVLSILTSASFAACSQEDLNSTSSEEAEMRKITITANELPVSRTSYTDENNSLSVNWKVGDVIYVGKAVTAGTSDITFDKEGSGFYKFTAESVDGKNATFTGELPVDINGTLLAIYGKANGIKVSKNTNTVSITGFVTQNWNNNDKITDIQQIIQNNLSEYDFMYAKIDNYQGESSIPLAFKHIGAVLKLNLSGLPASTEIPALGKNVYIKSSTGKPFFNYVNIFPDGSIQYAGSASEVYFNNLKKTSTDQNGNLVLYRTLIPTSEFNNDLTIEVYTKFESTNNPIETYSTTITGSTLEASKFYYTPEIVLTKK